MKIYGYILLVKLIFKFEFYYCLASFENLISELDSKGMWERGKRGENFGKIVFKFLPSHVGG